MKIGQCRRVDMKDVHELPYTNIYSKKEVCHQLSTFISVWKSHNHLRGNKQKLVDTLTETDLSYATSGKLQKTYVLYRGLDKYQNWGGVYYDEYPSSWSTDFIRAKTFALSKPKGVVLKAVVQHTNVFLDLVYLIKDYESEVILLPGAYAIEVVHMNVPSVGPDLTLLPYMSAKDVAAVLDTMTLKDIRKVCSYYGLKCPGRKKSEKIAALLPQLAHLKGPALTPVNSAEL